VQPGGIFCFVLAERVGFIAVNSQPATLHRSAAVTPGFYPISHRHTQSFGYAVIDGQDKQDSYEIN